MKKKRDAHLSSGLSLAPQWMEDMNKTPDTLKLSKEKVGNRTEFMDSRKDFLNRIPIA